VSTGKYHVWCPDIGDDENGKTIKAASAEDAAAIWARREDAESADYWIVGGDGATVIVRNEFGVEKVIRVRGEQCIEYYSRDITNEQCIEHDFNDITK